MATLYTHRTENIQKTWLLMSFFAVLVTAIGYGMSVYFGDTLILYLTLAFALITNVYSYFRSDSIVLSMSHAKEADPAEFRELHRMVENLAITAGLPKPRVFVIEDDAPNAFATGRDPEHGVVAVTRGLLAILEKEELEGVLAHELSHIGNRDVLIGTIAVVLVGFVATASELFVRLAGHRRGGKDPLILLFIVLAIILAPIAASLLRLAVSRKREFLADASGALLTRYPEGLARALTKIHQHGKEMRHANNATAHLFIANPFGTHTGISASLRKLYATHPPVKERVAALVGDVK